MYFKCSRNKVEMSEEEIFRKFRPYCAVLASQPSAECPATLAAVSVLHADPAAGGCPGRRGGGDGGPGQRDEAAAELPGVQ